MHTVKSLKEKKNHIIFSYNKNSKLYINMYFGFNNQFIKIIKTRPIFQKIPKQIIFFLILKITRFYIRRSLDIKKIA